MGLKKWATHYKKMNPMSFLMCSCSVELMEEMFHPRIEMYHENAIYAPRHAPAAQLYHPFACLTICGSACAAANDLWPFLNGDPIVTRAAKLTFAYLSCPLHLVNTCLVGTMRVCLGTATPVHSEIEVEAVVPCPQIILLNLQYLSNSSHCHMCASLDLLQPVLHGEFLKLSARIDSFPPAHYC